MLLRAADGSDLWLTYCMNVHPGGGVETTLEALDAVVRPLRARLGITGPFGVGLRFDGRGIDRLHADRALLARLRARLAGEGLVPFTANGFVVGAFHGTPVKADVYRPTWEDPERVAYTERFAEVLVGLAARGSTVSLSTAPGSWRPWVVGREGAAGMGAAANLAHVARTLTALHERHGVRVLLALEPEPGCTLQSIGDALAFFQGPLAEALGGDDAAAGHLGLCFDVCHHAVVHDPLPDAVERALEAGVPIHKVQASSALELGDPADASGRAALAAFDEPVYLHQVGAPADGGVAVAADLPDALGDPAWRDRRPWRVHFHVPVFRRGAAGGLDTTRDGLDAVLARCATGGVTGHLEVETYTWDVLPEVERRAGSGFDLVEALARELGHVREVLLAAGASAP